ncbi:MAG: hypothetical protein WAJ85_07800 [Candidatus Baltobacteraceae bacterium]
MDSTAAHVRPDRSLRPLGIGELLDRAVTLCVRHFVLFALIYVVYAIPFAIVQFYATRDVSRAIESFSTILQHAQAQGTKAAQVDEVVKALSNFPGDGTWTGLTIALTFLVAPLPVAALIHATTTSYLGGRATFAESYRVALSRWPALLGVNLLYLACASLIYFVAIVFLVFVVMALAFTTIQARTFGIALDVVVGAGFFLFGIAFGIAAALAVQISYFTCVVERASFAASFARGIGRVFTRVGLQRSLVVGLAFVAIGMGIFLVSLAGQSVILGVFRNEAAGTAYGTVLRVATAAFTTAFIAIFYYDLRVREEGLDLQLAAQATGQDALSTT